MGDWFGDVSGPKHISWFNGGASRLERRVLVLRYSIGIWKYSSLPYIPIPIWRDLVCVVIIFDRISSYFGDIFKSRRLLISYSIDFYRERTIFCSVFVHSASIRKENGAISSYNHETWFKCIVWCWCNMFLDTFVKALFSSLLAVMFELNAQTRAIL